MTDKKFEELLKEAYHLARANGFSNINVDLISAIPGQTVESWRRTLEQVMALSPEHISAYSLILEEGTTFYKKYVEDEAKEGPKLPDEDAERQMYWDTETLMEKNGYHRYEMHCRSLEEQKKRWFFRESEKASGNVKFLKDNQKKYGYNLIVVEKEQYHNKDISSTSIRKKITEGKMQDVNEMLGHPYRIIGKVEQGKHLGRTIGLPTANILPS